VTAKDTLLDDKEAELLEELKLLKKLRKLREAGLDL